MRPQLIAVANQKGGCGKTTTAINLAACLALKGVRTALIDLDPQSHATLGLGQSELVEGPGLAELMAGWSGPDQVLHPVAEGLDLVPSSWRLDDLETRLVRQESDAGFLRPVLQEACGNHQVLVLDCPPSTGLLTRGALDMADLVLIP
ncbi:MAG: ParA family protein, partial [Acidobacteriota bacterium]